jgi:outer membrane receptor protein involved in Fe transport
MMKKIISSIAMLATIATASSISQVGAAYSKGTDESKNITLFTTYNFAVGVGLRLEYSRNVSDYTEFLNADVSRYGLFATYTLPLGSSFSVTPKAGLVKTDGEFEMLSTLKKVSDSSTNFTYGLEVNYDVNENVSLFTGYTDYGHKFKNVKSITKSKIDSKNYTFGVKINL